jgi:hypothetical protein
MPEQKFDVLKLDAEGDISLVINDKDDTPNSVLQLNEDWNVDVDWHLKGSNVDVIDGDWVLSVQMESIGEGYEGPIHAVTEIELEAEEPDSTPVDRHWHRNVKADPGVPDVPGVYKVVVWISYQTEQDQPRPMGGFAEADLISFYKAK